MFTAIVQRPALRWSLILGALVSLGSAAWISRASNNIPTNHTGFEVEEHRVFRSQTPAAEAAAATQHHEQPAAPTGSITDHPPPATSPALDWPALFGPIGHSVSPSERVKTEWPETGPAERWRRPIGRGYSAPVVRDGRLIVFHRLGDEEVIEALDADTGERQWGFCYPTSYRCQVAYSDGPYSTPAASEDFVYAWSAQGTLRCLTVRDGQLVWQRELSGDFGAVENMFPVSSSPLLEDGKLILNVGGKKQQAGIVALDAKTGETLWTATDHLASYATPVAATIHGQRYVFVFTQTGLVAVNPDDGHVFWTIDFRSKNRDSVSATSPLVVGNLVVVSGFALGVLCVEVLPDGSYIERWRDRRVLDSQYTNLVTDGQYVYGCSARDNTYRCVNLTTGNVQWAWGNDFGRGAYSILVGRRAIFFGEPGRLATVELGGTEPVLRAMTTEALLAPPCFTMPALAHGRLYLRNESTLLCLDLTPD